MKQSKAYPNIDMIQTGKQLKQYIENAGMSVKDIQEQLHLSCPQPIYRWISGKILPSVDHLLVLSELFGVHMEELLVKKQKNISSETVINANLYFKNRTLVYYKRISYRIKALAGRFLDNPELDYNNLEGDVEVGES